MAAGRLTKKRIKAAALLFALAATAAVPFLSGSGGTAFKEPEEITAHAEGAYDKLAIELAGATAFDDARNAIKSAEDPDAARAQFEANLALLTGGMHFGNVGIFVGPKGTSKNSDVWSVYQSKVTISNDQIQAYDAVTDNAFTKYKAFGGAVQKLNKKAKKAKGASNSVEKGLDELSAAGAKITNLGLELISDYSPAPVLLAFFDSTALDTHPDNKLVAMVNANENLRKPVKFIGSDTSFGVPFSFLVLSIFILLLLGTSFLMTLVNGRAAGENIRKMLVKFAVGCIAVPLIAKALDSGTSFLIDVSTQQAATPESSYVEENLNFSDWYACGFGVPSGTTITINKNGEFVFSPEAVREINTYTYRTVWGVEEPTDTQMAEKMAEYYAMTLGIPQGVGFSEPVKDGGTKVWNTKNFYATLANFGENKVLNEGIELPDGVDRPDLGNVGYYITNATNMEALSGGGWKISGVNTSHGISPIAATNMMRTSFTGSAIVVNTNSTMGSVAFDVDNGMGAADGRMSAITRFLATFAMVMAALKGLFTIFSAGFAGIFSGGAKAMVGSSSGAGQAVGGAIALLGGVFGISIIMTLSFTLLDQLYGVMQELLSGTTAGNDILEPFKELVEDVPIIGPLLGDMLKSVARFVLTILCALTLPKFGGIPITLFCQHLAELPNRFAEKAQAIENKFTGDFRGGAGGHGNGLAQATNMAAQALSGGQGQLSGMGQGARTMAAAGAAYGLTKAGNRMADRYGSSEGGGSMAGGTQPEDAADAANAKQAEMSEAAAMEAAAMSQDAENTRPDDASAGRDEGQAPQAGPDAGESQADAETDGADGSGMNTTVEGSTSESTQVDGNDLKESDRESLSNTDEGASTEVSDTETAETTDSDTVNENTADTYSAESSMSAERTDSDIFAETEAYGEASTLATEDSLEQSVTENDASAAVHSEESMSMEATAESGAPGSSMAGGTEGQDAQGTQGAMAGRTGPSHDGAGRTSMAGGTQQTAHSKSGNGQRAGAGSPAARQALTREQKHARTMRAIGKGLQAAGGNTTGGQAIAGVAAGAAHVAGSAVGAGSVTGKGVAAVRNYHQRQNDIRAGLPAGYSRMQQEQSRNANAARRPGPSVGTPQQGMDAQRQNAMHAEAMAREAEADAQRQNAQRMDAQRQNYERMQRQFAEAERERRNRQ